MTRRAGGKGRIGRRPSDRDYAVGYGKPPADTRFQPGRSGNPKGRPKGSRNKAAAAVLGAERLQEIILEEAYRLVTVNEAGGATRLPIAQAVVRSLAVNAAKGNQRAQRLFTEILAAAERDRRRLNEEWFDTAITYKLEWEKELDRRARLGITHLPPPLPHPDHVVIDMRAGTALIRGPATKEEKALWDEWIARRADFEAEREELLSMLADPECEDRVVIEAELESTEKVLAILRRVMVKTAT